MIKAFGSYFILEHTADAGKTSASGVSYDGAEKSVTAKGKVVSVPSDEYGVKVGDYVYFKAMTKLEMVGKVAIIAVNYHDVIGVESTE